MLVYPVITTSSVYYRAVHNKRYCHYTTRKQLFPQLLIRSGWLIVFYVNQWIDEYIVLNCIKMKNVFWRKWGWWNNRIVKYLRWVLIWKDRQGKWPGGCLIENVAQKESTWLVLVEHGSFTNEISERSCTITSSCLTVKSLSKDPFDVHL